MAVSFFYILIGGVGGFVLGCHLMGSFNPPLPISGSGQFNVGLVEEAWKIIQKHYVDRDAVQEERLSFAAVSGMVDALGDTGHSRFLSSQMVNQEKDFTRGRFEGIGAEVAMRSNQVVIVSPMDGSPAQQAGLKPGDIITKVNGEDISGLPLDRVVARILGPAGTRVQLTILSASTGKTTDFNLIRKRITLHPVTWVRLPDTSVAHLRIASFSKGVAKDLQSALREIRREKLDGLILDLRSNPGGLFEEAVVTASQFLSSGNVLLEKDAQGKIQAVPVNSGGLATSLPLAVLINGGTASGAEIVAGAIQDANRAKLVGEKTFGTGTVLAMFPLRGGPGLLLAIREWLTPAGHLIWHHGISPDVIVALPPEVNPLLPVEERGFTTSRLRASGDVQLLRALDLLRDSGEKQAH